MDNPVKTYSFITMILALILVGVVICDKMKNAPRSPWRFGRGNRPQPPVVGVENLPASSTAVGTDRVQGRGF